jgi:putative tricarboxylic transport membrane protein
MSSLEALLAGMSNVFSWPGILIPIAGTLLAMVASFLPGLGNASVAVLAMVLTLNWEPTSVLLLFGALTGGATFMGSITAILFNIPGSVSSTPALLEGYPLSKRGLTRTAIACAATASAVGSVFGVLLLLTILPVVEPLILKVGPLEILLIGVLGLLTIVAVPSKSKLKSACMVGLGLLFAMVGTEPLQSLPRWSLGSIELGAGIGLVPMIMGIFTISELIEWMRPVSVLRPETIRKSSVQDSTRKGIFSVFKNWGLTLRCSAIGSLVGMVPGIGGTVAGFVAYGHAVQSSPKEQQTFGHGNIKGLIAPEAAVDAKDGGSLLPTLALGLPGSEACVILLAVFSMHGLVPGTPMLTTHLALTYTLILALLFSNLLTSAAGVLLAPALSKLGNLRINRIALPCLLICIVSAVQLEGRIMDLYVMLFFGVLGYFWRTYDWPRIPFVIAFVLASVIEKNLALTYQLTAVGRIGMLNSFMALGAVFAVLLAMGWLWVKKSRSDPTEIQHSADGIGLGLIVLTASSVMLAMSFLNSDAYSKYAITVAMATVLLSACVVLSSLRRQLQKQQGRQWLADLSPLPGHAPGFAFVAGLLPGIWLVGLGPAVGIGVAFLSWRSQSPRYRWVLAALTGALAGWLLDKTLSDWANVALEAGWLLQIFQPLRSD